MAEKGSQTANQKLLRERFTEFVYPENGGELILALVNPLGTDEQSLADAIHKELKARDYKVIEIKLSQLISDYSNPPPAISTATSAERIEALQEAGNKLREEYGGSILAELAIAKIAFARAKLSNGPSTARPQRCAYLIRSLKHPEEAIYLRTVYEYGFYLFASHASYMGRISYLQKQGIKREDIQRLILHDEKEEEPYGQNTRETFELADFFFDSDRDILKQVTRIMNLAFNALYETPTRDEYGMFLAHSAALRSGDLSRQVGAAILDSTGDMIAAGCNEVPRAGGGSYWAADLPDGRDFRFGVDPNDSEKTSRFKLFRQFLVDNEFNLPDELLDKAWRVSGLKDITEFGRTVHAEMDAIMSCGRRGVPLSSATLYATTFPCHNCARHIVAAGISRVVYIEPYAKSAAYSLYGDSIDCKAHPKPEGRDQGGMRIPFEPFSGVAPRRFFQFFSMRHPNGRRIERKTSSGRIYSQQLNDLSHPRLGLSEFSYLQKEENVMQLLNSTLPGAVQSGPHEDANLET